MMMSVVEGRAPGRNGMAERVELSEVRTGRNFIRVGDPVRLKPVHGTSFETKVHRIVDVGGVVEVEGRHPRTGAIRTVTVDRVVRKAVRRSGK